MARVVKIKGLGDLRRNLAALQRQVDRGSVKAVRSEGENGALMMRTFAPVDTGELQDSIDVEFSRGGMEAQIGPRDDVEHALPVEYGTSRMGAQPYATPTAESVRRTFARTLAAAVKKELP